jgi:hypothetical protein
MNILIEIPEDIQYNLIDNYLTMKDLRLLNTSGAKLLPQKENKKIVDKVYLAASRIKLFIILLNNKKILFRKIDRILNRHFKYNFHGMMRFNDECLLYAPVTQYGTCRFCERNISKHRYVKMMNIYLALTTSNE